MEGQPIETDLPPDSASPCRRRGSCRWTVYLLRCRDGSLYTGITNDLPKRLKTEPAKTGPAKGLVSGIDKMIPEYYELRGWDQDGRLKPETRARLGL